MILTDLFRQNLSNAKGLPRKPSGAGFVGSFGNDANVWQGYARFIAGFNDWRFAAVGGLAGGNTLIGA